MKLVLSIVASDILPIFIIAGVGFVLARLVDASLKTLSRVVFNALVPCLVFDLLISSQMTGGQFARMALFCALPRTAWKGTSAATWNTARLDSSGMISSLD